MDPVPDREKNAYIATLADRAERYEDVITEMKEVVKMNVELTTAQRKLLSTAYHKLISARTSSWKTLVAIEDAQCMRGEMEYILEIRGLAAKVAEEIYDLCSDAMSLFTGHVLPHCTSPKDKVFYYTVMGDCYGYLMTYHKDQTKRNELIKNGMTAYGGITIAEENLHAADPTRLLLALNLSVFHYDIRQSVEDALKVAEFAVLEVGNEVMIDIFSSETTQYLGCLKENITKWRKFGGVHANVEKADIGRVKAPRIDDDFLPLIKEVVKWANDNVVNVAATLEGPELVD